MCIIYNMTCVILHNLLLFNNPVYSCIVYIICNNFITKKTIVDLVIKLTELTQTCSYLTLQATTLQLVCNNKNKKYRIHF